MTVTIDSGAVSGGLTPYLSPDEFTTHCRDIRTAADLGSDTGDRLGDSRNVSAMAAAIRTAPKVLAAIQSACGLMESRALRSGMYTVAELTQIAGSGTVAAQWMKKLLADVTMAFLWRPSMGPMPRAYEEAHREIEELGKGQAIFGSVEKERAGLVSSRVERPAEIRARKGIDYRNPYLGRRHDQEESDP